VYNGVVGIAWALLELAAVTGDRRYEIAARQTIDHERALNSSKTAQLPNLSQDGHSTAAGIGLARLCLLQHWDDPTLYDEIRGVVQTVLTHGFGQSHALHHGDMGNLDLLLQAAHILKDERYHRQMERLTAMVLESIERDGWQCSGPNAVEIPGLMLGLAGIGYMLLRLAQPDRVPSVLLLAPPAQ
jgi:lantibiotic modifying enzyme